MYWSIWQIQVDAERVAYATESALSSAMTPYQTKLQVRKGVIEALKDNAELTQSKYLELSREGTENGNVAEFTPYHIVNMVYVKATKEVIEKSFLYVRSRKIYENKIHTLGEVKLDSEIKPSDNSLEWNIERVKANEVWGL